MTVNKKAHVLEKKFLKPDFSSSVGSNFNSPHANPSKDDPPDPKPDPPEPDPLPPTEEGLDPDKDNDNDEEEDRDVDSPIDNL